MAEARFGRYKILGLLGEGGMAQVHLAEDPVLHRCVALKVIRSALAVKEEWIRRFHQEATTVARLGNPHVVQVFDLGCQDGQEFLVMEFLDRGSLEKNLAKAEGRLSPVQAACVAVQAAEGLRAAHEAGVIHRDVKPDNLLLSREGIVKVADFGIARLQGEISRTQTGTAMGSPQFMAPEQIEGKEITEKADVFALAGVLHLAISGHHPFEAEQAHALMWKIVSSEAPELCRAVPDCPKELSRLVRAMHSRHPEKRPDMAEVVQRLRVFLAESGILDPAEHLRAELGFPQTPRPDGQGSSTTRIVKIPKVASRLRRQKMRVAGAALAAITLVVVGVLMLRL